MIAFDPALSDRPALSTSAVATTTLGTAKSLFLYGSRVPPSTAVKREFSKSHKMGILAIIAFGAFLVPLGTGELSRGGRRASTGARNEQRSRVYETDEARE